MAHRRNRLWVRNSDMNEVRCLGFAPVFREVQFKSEVPQRGHALRTLSSLPGQHVARLLGTRLIAESGRFIFQESPLSLSNRYNAKLAFELGEQQFSFCNSKSVVLLICVCCKRTLELSAAVEWSFSARSTRIPCGLCGDGSNVNKGDSLVSGPSCPLTPWSPSWRLYNWAGLAMLLV